MGIVFVLLARRCHLWFHLEELIAGAGNGLFDDVAFDVERWIFVGADTPIACHGANCDGSFWPPASPAKARNALLACDLKMKMRMIACLLG